MRTPHSLKEAKAIVHEEKVKVSSSISAIAGSRWLMAILATFALAFAIHAAYAPARLPTIGGLSLAQVGLPSGVDFGVVGEQAKQAQEAAARQNVGGHATGLIDQYSALIPYINYAGFGLAIILLLVNMTIMTKRRRFTRG